MRTVCGRLFGFEDLELEGDPASFHSQYLGLRNHDTPDVGGFHVMKFRMDSNRYLIVCKLFAESGYCGLLRKRQDSRGRQHGNIAGTMSDSSIGITDHEDYLSDGACCDHDKTIAVHDLASLARH